MTLGLGAGAHRTPAGTFAAVVLHRFGAWLDTRVSLLGSSAAPVHLLPDTTP